MVTTGGVFGTLWPAGGMRTGPGPRGPLLGVLTGELWLVAGEDTGEDSLLMEDAAVAGERRERGAVSDVAPGGAARPFRSEGAVSFQ